MGDNEKELSPKEMKEIKGGLKEIAGPIGKQGDAIRIFRRKNHGRLRRQRSRQRGKRNRFAFLPQTSGFRMARYQDLEANLTLEAPPGVSRRGNLVERHKDAPSEPRRGPAL
jgi:hypothetical protein